MNTNSSQTSNDWIKLATKKLKEADISSAHLDAQIILERYLNKSKLDLITKNFELNNKDIDALNKLLIKRVNRVPLAYIFNKIEFYNHDFYVNESVLIPRIESESFINIINSLNLKNVKIIDLGCGSGCIGISIKLDNQDFDLTLVDISKNALEITKINSEKLNAKVSIKIGSFEVINKLKPDVIVTNLPYLPDNLSVESEINLEPKIALYSGIDGLDLYRNFWKEVELSKNKPIYILTESMPEQFELLDKLAKKSGYNFVKRENLVRLYHFS